MPQESITSTRKNNTKYSNREYWKIQRKRQTASWEQKTKYKKEETLGKTDKYDDRNQRYREGNKEAMRQTQRERYKRDKDKINAKSRERRKQKNKLQLLINQ